MSAARNQRRLEKKRRLPQVNTSIAQSLVERPCNTCTACCTVMGVTELKKPVNTACVHLCGTGCGIYDQRPSGCRTFNCIWRYGLLGPEDRPDKLGIVFDITGKNRFNPDIQMLVAREVWPGAFGGAEAVLDRLVREGHLVLLIDPENKRRLIGPPDKVALVQKTLQLVEIDG